MHGVNGGSDLLVMTGGKGAAIRGPWEFGREAGQMCCLKWWQLAEEEPS